jgi:16S rRNA (guanine(1405)-N(7))-methyltransferase
MDALFKSQVKDLTAYVLEKPKYRQINTGLIASIAESELLKGRKLKETQKSVLSKLHQVGTAYFAQKQSYAEWTEALALLPGDINSEEVEDFCVDVMRTHFSTSERLPILDDFYQTILNRIQPIPSILDLACGLNPLALPWMPVEADVRYIGCDIFRDMVAFLKTFGKRFNLDTEFYSCNLLDAHFSEQVKVAFLLKTIPCLEQLEKGFPESLLRAIPAEYILISYPISSLSGKAKGMQENYTNQFNQLMTTGDWTYERFAFSSELAFLVKKS